MRNKLIKFEICGIFFVIIMSVFLQNLHSICNGDLIGVMFGSVNDSIWETVKTMLLPYLLWGIIEVMCFHTPFKKFVSSKIISLYYLGISYILLCLVFSMFESSSRYLLEFTSAIFSISTASFLSYRLVQSHFELEKLFAPSFFMFLLFTAVYCSFTPFPPRLYVFMDRATGLYGIIPDHIDAGAIALDTLHTI